MNSQIYCPKCEMKLAAEFDEANPYIQCGHCNAVLTRTVGTGPSKATYGRQLFITEEAPAHHDWDRSRLRDDSELIEPRLTFHRRRRSSYGWIIFGAVGLVALFVFMVVGQIQVRRSLLTNHNVRYGTPDESSSFRQLADSQFADLWDLAGVTITYEGAEGKTRMTFEDGVEPLHGLSLMHLAHDVKEIDLSGTQLADRHMHMLAERGEEITWLDLSDTELTDVGIIQLREFTKLHTLRLTNCQITDESMAIIVRFSKLQELSLWGTQISDEGLMEIGRLSGLTLLELGETDIGDRALGKINSIRTLQSLGLGSTLVTDDGLNHLVKLRDLTNLDLVDTSVSDEAIEHLSKLQGLGAVDLRRTKFSENGIRKLNTALPRTYVRHAQP